MLIYDVDRGLWQPPQNISGSRLAVINGEWYMHSLFGDETYKLDDGYTDNGIKIDCKAYFAYNSWEDRAMLKDHTERYVEMYLTNNQTAEFVERYEYRASAAEKRFTIDTTNPAFIFEPMESAGLGQVPLGSEQLGGNAGAEEESNAGKVKYRRIFGSDPMEYFEIQSGFEWSQNDSQAEILSLGMNVRQSVNYPQSITD